MDKNQEILSQRLIEARSKRRLTQELLASAIGINKRQVARYEAGDSYPRVSTQHKLADALGVTVEWLTGEEEECKGKVLPLLPPGLADSIELMASKNEIAPDAQVLKLLYTGVAQWELERKAFLDREIKMHLSDELLVKGLLNCLAEIEKDESA